MISEATNWFITLSMPDRGGMSEEDIQNFINKIKNLKNHKGIVCIKEMFNKYDQIFPHIHILYFGNRIRRQDKVRDTFKKYHPNLSKNVRDINVKNMISASTLLNNYLTKQQLVETIYEDIDEEFKEILKERCAKDEKKQYPLKGKKVPSLLEIPYIIEQEIREKGIVVTSLQDMNFVMKDMIRNREFVLVHLYRKRLDIWKTLSVLLDLNVDWSIPFED